MILEKPFAAVVTIGVPAARALMHAFENGSYDLRMITRPRAARIPRRTCIFDLFVELTA